MSEIITTPDPRLRQKSTKVNRITDETHAIIAEMVRLSLEWEKSHPHELSAAMAAPQMGVNQRIIIVRDDLNDKSNNSFTALINPEVIKTDGRLITEAEGCLSVPEIYGMVSRPNKVKVKAQLEDGQDVRIKTDGFLARTLMHEIDHLNGILFIDHIKDDPTAFYRLNDKGDLEPVDYATKIKDNPELFPDEA